MQIFTLEIIRTYEEDSGMGGTYEFEEKIIAGLYTSKQQALSDWKEKHLPDGWEDYDLTEWEV